MRSSRSTARIIIPIAIATADVKMANVIEGLTMRPTIRPAPASRLIVNPIASSTCRVPLVKSSIFALSNMIESTSFNSGSELVFR